MATLIFLKQAVLLVACLTEFNSVCFVGIEIHVPYFGGHSFVRHPGLERSSLSFTEIEMVFKPISWEGLILYNGYTNDRKGDFISLAMRKGHLEFKFDLGTGPGVLR